MLQIISGELKSQKILQPNTTKTRPVSQKVRAAIFNVLGNRVEGAQVADLFAGSGSLGIEALSRGADFAVFVEKDIKALSVIKNNIQKLNLKNRSSVMHLNVKSYIKSASELQDIIFLDPPYVDFNIELVNTVVNLLKSTGVIVVSCSIKASLTGLSQNYKIAQQKVYGDTQIIYIIKQ